MGYDNRVDILAFLMKKKPYEIKQSSDVQSLKGDIMQALAASTHPSLIYDMQDLLWRE